MLIDLTDSNLKGVIKNLKMERSEQLLFFRVLVINYYLNCNEVGIIDDWYFTRCNFLL